MEIQLQFSFENSPYLYLHLRWFLSIVLRVRHVLRVKITLAGD